MGVDFQFVENAADYRDGASGFSGYLLGAFVFTDPVEDLKSL